MLILGQKEEEEKKNVVEQAEHLKVIMALLSSIKAQYKNVLPD